MTIDFQPGDRVRIADSSPYNDEFKGKFATIVDPGYEPTPNMITVNPDGDPLLKGMVQTAHLTYIPKKGDIVRVDAPSAWQGEREVISADNDALVTLLLSSSGRKAKYNVQSVTLVRRAEPAVTDHTDQYPLNATVRDTKYDLYGTVTSHRTQHGVTFPVVRFSNDSPTPFPNPEERLERVHVLTHKELVNIDEAVPVSDRSYDKRANEILSAHLNPTVTRTFTVTVVQPADAPKPADAAWLQQNVQRHAPNTEITIEEQTR